MNYDVSSEKLSVGKLVFEGCKEVPIDLDFSLPDYCPDVQKILKCRVFPNINSRSISGDRLNIDGEANIRVIYIDAENNQIRCCENTAAFSASIDIKSTPENAVCFTFAKTEYMNCRAVSQRKIDVHGAISIFARIYGKAEQNISCSVNGKDIQQKIETFPVSALVGIGQQQFSLNEVLDMEGSISPELIVNSTLSVNFSDYKVMPNKVVAKGEAILKVLYMDDLSSGNLGTSEYKIPISQIVDVPGAKEGGKYIITGEVLGHSEKIHPGSDETKNMISLESKIVSTVMYYEEKEMGIVSDIYSTKYDLNVQKSDVNLTHLENIINETFDQKLSIPMGNVNISEIIDIWSENCSASGTNKENTLDFKSKINICILAYGENHVPFYIERTAEFEYQKEIDDLGHNMVCAVKVSPRSIGYRLPSENTIDIKLTCDISAGIFRKLSLGMVTDADCDESKPIPKDRSNSLTVYYTEENEPLWDIARKYHTSLRAIKDENDISDDSAKQESCRVLLIPIK